jgi:hypothetical protein
MDMNMKSINEPDAPSHIALTPTSINEPPSLPDWATEPPVVTGLEPAECTLGDPSFTIYVSGTGFFPESVIVFAGHDEPTTFEDDKLSTGVNMDVWQGPDTVQVSVRNGPIMSNSMGFTFNAPEGGVAAVDPDDLEEEIDEAEEEGDFKPVHRGRPSHTLSNKRSKAKR